MKAIEGARIDCFCYPSHTSSRYVHPMYVLTTKAAGFCHRHNRTILITDTTCMVHDILFSRAETTLWCCSCYYKDTPRHHSFTVRCLDSASPNAQPIRSKTTTLQLVFVQRRSCRYTEAFSSTVTSTAQVVILRRYKKTSVYQIHLH